MGANHRPEGTPNQNFEEIDKKEIETLIKEADIREPIEELLQMV